MKKMMLVAAVALGGWAFASAGQTETAREYIAINTEIQPLAIQQQEQQDSVKRTLVEPENLPQGVKTTLSGEEYTGWTVATAYHVESRNKAPYYEISLEREGEEDLKVIKLDADGKRKDRELSPPTTP